VRHVAYRLHLLVPENAAVAPGLSYTYYTVSNLSSLPDFSPLAPVKTGIVDSLTLSPATQTENYAILYEGYLSAPADGIYFFTIRSDDGADLWIGNTRVVNNGDSHSTDDSKSGMIGLKAGLHSIRVGYSQGTGGSTLAIAYACTTTTKTLAPIGKAVCFHRAGPAAAAPGNRLDGPPDAGIRFVRNTSMVCGLISGKAVPRVSISTTGGRSIALRPELSNGTMRWDPNALPGGIYFVKIQAGGRTMCRSIIAGKY